MKKLCRLACAVIADEQSTYDEKNRLRSTTYLDGTSLTNAYSCCRLLWSRDRQNRTTLRSAQTGTDHLYNAMEDVWMGDVSTNGQYRVTQHFCDALGRETNTVIYAGTTPGEAAVPIGEAALLPLQHTGGAQLVATASTAYPYGGSSHSVHTDERGATTTTYTSYGPGYTEQTEYTITNVDSWAVLLTTTTRTYHGGGSSTRREWPGGSQLAATAWTDERRFTDYAPNGYRVDYVVTTSSDHFNVAPNGLREYVAVTNSISTYDLLGRLVSVETPCAAPGGAQLAATEITMYAYAGATSRILTSTRYAPTLAPRTTTYLYNDWGEQVGTVLDGITNRTDTTYETDASNIVWRVETSTVIGPSTNFLSVTRTQLTGLSDACRRHVVTFFGGADAINCVPPGTPPGGSQLAATETTTTYDPATGIETETVTTSTGPTVIRRSLHGVLLSEEIDSTTILSSYDALGRVISTSRQIGRDALVASVQSFDYSPSGDLLATHTYTNSTDILTETYAYDMLGNRIATTDALGNTTYRTYDPLGNVTAEWGATYPVRYTYDTQNRRTSLTTYRTPGGTQFIASADLGDTATWTYDPYTSLCTSKTYAVVAAKLGDIPSALKLMYKAKNGTFKGSFKAYADVERSSNPFNGRDIRGRRGAAFRYVRGIAKVILHTRSSALFGILPSTQNSRT